VFYNVYIVAKTARLRDIRNELRLTSVRPIAGKKEKDRAFSI
jgi:hypothetical protein